MGGPIGVNWPGVETALKAAGLLDEDAGAIPEQLFVDLRVMFAETMTWKLCPRCTEERRKPKVCSVCGTEYDDSPATQRPLRSDGLIGRS